MKSFIHKPSLALAMALSPNGVLRSRTLDHQTFDSSQMATAPIDAVGNQRGKSLDHAFKTHDGRTVDSTGAFMIGELERLDQTLHMPLAAVSWSRDIDLREDVSLADEFSSFLLATFASGGNMGQGGTTGKDRGGKAWIGKSTDQIGGVGVDAGKLAFPLTPWALEIKYTILELESAAKMGRPIDSQKFAALQLKHQMDIDEQVYVGDSILNQTGLFNNTLVTNVANLPNGASASPLWTSKTPAEILADVNAILQSTWAASGYSVMPSRILIPPTQFGALSTQVVSTAGSVSILKYLLENNIVKASGNGSIDIQPAKWLQGAGAASADRMVAYSKRKDFVRYPMTQLQRTPIQYDSIYHKCSYFCRLGQVEVVYPETLAYRDGL